MQRFGSGVRDHLQQYESRSELHLFDFHTALDTSLDSHTVLVLDRITPFVNMLAAPHRVTKLICTGFAEIPCLSPKGVSPRLALEVHQLLLELCLLPRFLLRLTTFVFGVEGLGGAPFRRECVLLDLEPKEEHHVVPVGLVWIRLVEVRQQLRVAQFLVCEQIVLLALRFREERVFLWVFLLAPVADADVEDLVPDKVDLQAITVAALLPVLGVLEDAQARLEGAGFEPLEVSDGLQPFPFLHSHVFRPLIVLLLSLFCRAERIVVGVIFGGEETALGVGHSAHVVVDKLGKLFRRPQSLLVALDSPIAVCGRRVTDTATVIAAGYGAVRSLAVCSLVDVNLVCGDKAGRGLWDVGGGAFRSLFSLALVSDSFGSQPVFFLDHG